MPNTVIEKIFQTHLRDDSEKVEPGRTVWINIDTRLARDFGGANVVEHLEKHYPDAPVKDKEKSKFTFDCNAPATTIGFADNQHKCRMFAVKHDVEVFDIEAGIGSHVVMEDGLVRPGMTAIGTDSHMNILGAIGAFGQGMGDYDTAFIWANGYTWFEVPETVKITLTGRHHFPTTAKDIALFLAGQLGTKKLLGKAVEYYGDAVDRMHIEERVTIASMATEMGAIISFFPPHSKLLDLAGRRIQMGSWEDVKADENAQYAEEIEFDINDLPPLVARPGSPNDIVPVIEVTGQRIDTGFLGSCTNGRITDMQDAKNVMKDRKLATAKSFKIVPATRKVYSDILAKGLLQDFFISGAIIQSPGCGGCAAGQVGMTGTGEVQISTSNRNYKGKQGKGSTWLGSPATAAAAVITGQLIDPREVLL
ncbi:MAG TPA: aconitase family protein [bacterium]